MKKSPERMASKGWFVFWMVFGVFMATWGALQLIQPDGNKFFGLISFAGFSLMTAREFILRRRWLKENKGK